jgi:hypothetical protein
MSYLVQLQSDATDSPLHHYPKILGRPHSLRVGEHIQRIELGFYALQLLHVTTPIKTRTVFTQRRIYVTCIRPLVVIWECVGDDFVDAGEEVLRFVVDLVVCQYML